MSDEKETGSSLREALTEAQNIVNAAKERADQLLADAEGIRQQARDEGYEAGFAEGKAEASASAVRLLEESGAIGDRLSEQAAHLALAIAGSVIGEHVKVEPETAKRMALKALQEAVVGETACVTVHPEDADLLRNSVVELRRVSGGATLTIAADEAIGRGSCMVSTDFGEVDASIDGLLRAVAARLGVASHVK